MRRGGHTWWVLVAGERPDEYLGTWRRAAAVGQSLPRESESESERASAYTRGEVNGRRKDG